MSQNQPKPAISEEPKFLTARVMLDFSKSTARVINAEDQEVVIEFQARTLTQTEHKQVEGLLDGFEDSLKELGIQQFYNTLQDLSLIKIIKSARQ